MQNLPHNQYQYLVIGNPENRRVTLFQEALAKMGRHPAFVVAWLDLLTHRTPIAKILEEQASRQVVLRIESPGENFDVERELLRLGFHDAEERCVANISPKSLDALAFDLGRILFPRQWYLGFSRILRSLAEIVAATSPNVRFMNEPGEIITMFDKSETHQICGESGLPVPPALGEIQSFEQLLTKMRAENWSRVFVKLAHGSSASGVGAFQLFPNGKMRLTTTVESQWCQNEIRLYNSLKIRTYTQHREISGIIDELCKHQVHVEKWMPKAVQDGYPFDLRIVSIGQNPAHTVVRLGKSPITNLHLGNKRGDFERLKQSMKPEQLDAAYATCRKVAQRFCRSYTIGIDLLLTPRFHRHVILELNAFGDLLPNCFYENKSTYEMEIETFGNS